MKTKTVNLFENPRHRAAIIAGLRLLALHEAYSDPDDNSYPMTCDEIREFARQIDPDVIDETWPM